MTPRPSIIWGGILAELELWLGAELVSRMDASLHAEAAKMASQSGRERLPRLTVADIGSACDDIYRDMKGISVATAEGRDDVLKYVLWKTVKFRVQYPEGLSDILDSFTIDAEIAADKASDHRVLSALENLKTVIGEARDKPIHLALIPVGFAGNSVYLAFPRGDPSGIPFREMGDLQAFHVMQRPLFEHLMGHEAGNLPSLA